MLSEAAGALDPNVALAIGVSFFMLMLLSTVAVTTFAVLRPRMRLKRRMADLGLVGAAGAGGAGKGGNPRQKRIQEKLQEMEERGKQKKRRNQIRSDILQAGLEINVRNYVVFTAIAGLVAAALSILFGLPIVAAIPIGLIAFFGLPKLVLRFMARGRQNKFTTHFTGAIDVVVRCIRSGLPVGECLAIIGREIPDPVGQEFRLLVEAQKIGVSTEELLRRGLERIPTSEYKFFAIVLQIQQQTGGNLADTLANLSDVLRERKKMKDKVQALSSEAKASAMIIGSLPFFVMGMISLINPEYMALLFTETLGQFMLAAGMTWMAIGIIVMSKMINFDLWDHEILSRSTEHHRHARIRGRPRLDFGDSAAVPATRPACGTPKSRVASARRTEPATTRTNGAGSRPSAAAVAGTRKSDEGVAWPVQVGEPDLQPGTQATARAFPCLNESRGIHRPSIL